MKRIVALLSLALVSTPLLADDAGDAIFPIDQHDKARASLLYQNLQRDLEITSDALKGESVELDADVYALRLNSDLGEYGQLDFDLGGIDAGGDLAFYGGIGLRYLAYDAASWRASAYGQIHYAPDIGEDDVDADLLTADTGILLTYKGLSGEQLSVLPYAGPALSIIDLSGDVDAEQETNFGGVAGLALQFPGGNGLRFEGQFFDETSFSVAASFLY